MIVDAALSVIHAKGVAGATTRAIVKAVPCSEGSLYVHFTDRTQLLVAVIRKVVGGFSKSLSLLDGQEGKGHDPYERLVALMLEGLQFYRAALPVLAGVISDPQVLLAQQEAFSALDRGPKTSRGTIAAFISKEIKQHRLSASINPDSAAAMMLYVPLGRAFEERFTGRRPVGSDVSFCKQSVATILQIG
ncbi:TetR/AcrR family transcriptional regulator [Tunturiibacter empetritectus]|uniref:AcrR family transcriptional regulator n=1 Tax=Tunturiibacter lichenicola TaxID=2051959 RepID=A0A852VFN5_9BACT|nr:TetR/AcrR family transcriptional regulator [Edaphobacter lichenicola]NYF90407.1 AcrR family transcriptional regulator [Edaphobacter lichenicola]